MAFRISFKPGMEQSQQAARYFHDTVGGVVEAMIDGMEERQYRIAADHGPALQLRVWSVAAPDQEELHTLMELLLALRGDVRALQEDPGGSDKVANLTADWLSVHLNGADLYIELAIEQPGDGADTGPEFAMGLVRGRCAMISTDTFLFTWLEEGVFGLTLAGYGSYLVETIPGRKAATPPWKQAS